MSTKNFVPIIELVSFQSDQAQPVPQPSVTEFCGIRVVKSITPGPDIYTTPTDYFTTLRIATEIQVRENPLTKLLK